MDAALNGIVPPPVGHRAHDIARDVMRVLNEGLTNPAATEEFMAAADAYYRRLHEVDPITIPADWRDWEIRSRASGERRDKAFEQFRREDFCDVHGYPEPCWDCREEGS